MTEKKVPPLHKTRQITTLELSEIEKPHSSFAHGRLVCEQIHACGALLYGTLFTIFTSVPMNVNFEDVKSIRYDPDFERYAGFFDHKWARDFERVWSGTILQQPVFDLMLEWKATSCVRRFPWLMMHAIKKGIEGALDTIPPAEVQVNLELRSIWDSYLGQREFIMGLWMSEISSYCAVYFAYEVFLVESLRLVTHNPNLRSYRLAQTIRQLLGDSMTSSCWLDPSVEKARLIRHAVAHNGRQITPELEKFRSQLLLQDNEVVIYARDTSALFALLKERVQLFSEALLQQLNIRTV